MYGHWSVPRSVQSRFDLYCYDVTVPEEFFPSAAPSYKKLIQPHFKHPGTLFSTAVFSFERPLITEEILALGFYRLGHQGIACYRCKNFENLEIEYRSDDVTKIIFFFEIMGYDVIFL